MPIVHMRPRGVNKKDAAKAALKFTQGEDSPEGVVTGLVEHQPFTQYDSNGDVVATWQFQGTLGETTGWVNLTP